MQRSIHADISHPPGDDDISTKVAKTLLTVAIVPGFLLLLSFFAMRFSLLLWALCSLLLLPIPVWFRLDFKKWCIRSLVIALVLAFSPIDIGIAHLGRPGLHFMRANHGLVHGGRCPTGELCYGCFVDPWPAGVAVVISY